MAIPWLESVRNKGELLVFAGSGLAGGMWATAFTDAISAFNGLMAANNFDLQLSISGDPPSEKGGADVKVDTAADQYSFTFAGQTISKSFDGNALHGATLQAVATGRLIWKAFTFVPKTPRLHGKPEAREVGPEVRRYILVHEFIHAAGLDNSDHTYDDVFGTNPEVVEGKRPEDDRLHPWGLPSLVMPPYILSNKTVQKLKPLWHQFSD
jgi:hypothetical protein